LFSERFGTQHYPATVKVYCLCHKIYN